MSGPPSAPSQEDMARDPQKRIRTGVVDVTVVCQGAAGWGPRPPQMPGTKLSYFGAGVLAQWVRIPCNKKVAGSNTRLG